MESLFAFPPFIKLPLFPLKNNLNAYLQFKIRIMELTYLDVFLICNIEEQWFMLQILSPILFYAFRFSIYIHVIALLEKFAFWFSCDKEYFKNWVDEKVFLGFWFEIFLLGAMIRIIEQQNVRVLTMLILNRLFSLQHKQPIKIVC